jgi:hypothetical protein
MTSSDRPVPEPESVRPDQPPPTPREPTCRIIYRTPETFTVGDASRMMADTPAVLSFAAVTAAIPTEQLPVERGYTIEPGLFFWTHSWQFSGRRPGSSRRQDELATIMPVRRLSYASPLEIILAAPEHYVAAGAIALWAIPTIVARFSRLRAIFARDRLDREVYDALRERVLSDDVLIQLDAQAFDGLYNIEKAITEDGEKTLDSDTAETDIDDYLKLLDDHGIQEDQGFDNGEDS